MMRRRSFDEMEQLFDRMRRSMLGGPGGFGGDANLSLEPTEGGYVVLADLPGFEREEIDLRFDDGELVVDAVHETTDDGHARSRRVHERLTVPATVLADAVEATYRNGVLEVFLPTEEEVDDVGHSIDIE